VTFKSDLIGKRLADLYDDQPHLFGKKTSATSFKEYIRSVFIPETQVVTPGFRGAQSWDVHRQNSLFLVREICDDMAYSADAPESEPDEAEEEGPKLKKSKKAQEDKDLKAGPKRTNEAWLERVDATGGIWRLHFHAIHRCLKRALVYGIVEQEHGKESIRVMRILDTWGRLDEKTVCQQPVRQHLLTLFASRSTR
jgi:hypothetical protein